MPRPVLKQQLRPYRKEIQKRFAKDQTKEDIIAWLASINVPCDILDLCHFDGIKQQKLIADWRRKMTKRLPIKDENWCLLKLNQIAADPDSSANEILGAIRTSRQLTKKESAANPRDWQNKAEEA